MISGHVLVSFPALLDSPPMPDQENLGILLLEDAYLHLIPNIYYLPTYHTIRQDSLFQSNFFCFLGYLTAFPQGFGFDDPEPWNSAHIVLQGL